MTKKARLLMGVILVGLILGLVVFVGNSKNKHQVATVVDTAKERVFGFVSGHWEQIWPTTPIASPILLTLTPSASPSHIMKSDISDTAPQWIRNGQFEQALTDWEVVGRVELAISAESLPPSVMSKSISIGSLQNAAKNSISQTIATQQKGQQLAALSFYFQLVTTETDPGFDEPAFRVLINEKELFVLSAYDVLVSNVIDQNLRSTRWQQIVIPLSYFTMTPELRLSFEVSDTGDEENPTIVYLADVRGYDTMAWPLPSPKSLTFDVTQDELGFSLSWVTPKRTIQNGAIFAQSYEFQPTDESPKYFRDDTISGIPAPGSPGDIETMLLTNQPSSLTLN